MNQPAVSAVHSGIIVTTLKRHWHWLVIPTVLATLAALAYAVLRQPQWEASQALLVRDEAGAETDHLGRFVSADAMKAFQETVQELAQNHLVVKTTLQVLGPPPNYRPKKEWPTERDIERARGRIRVGAPRGAEFGRTEVIYLTVSDVSRKRALAFCRTLCEQLDGRMGRLRNETAESLIAELERTAAIAQQDLEQVTERLQALEREVGTDLGELRDLTDHGSGGSSLRASLNQLETEHRAATATLREQQQREKLLLAAQADPERLLATPSHLLESQPALRHLREGLVEAQLRTAELMGSMNADHPRVRAAKSEEEEIRRNMYAELNLAVAALAADIEVSQDRIAALDQQSSRVRERLDRLADLRARYSNLAAEVEQRTRIVEAGRADLANARASRSSAQTASLLTRVDTPLAGDYPLGPSRKIIVLGGLLGGLATGFGLLFLVSPLGTQVGQVGRRWTDQVIKPWGRRKTDQPSDGRGRRAGDQAAVVASRCRRAEDRDVAAPGAGRREEDRPFAVREAEPSEMKADDGDDWGRRASDRDFGFGAAPLPALEQIDVDSYVPPALESPADTPAAETAQPQSVENDSMADAEDDLMAEIEDDLMAEAEEDATEVHVDEERLSYLELPELMARLRGAEPEADFQLSPAGDEPTSSEIPEQPESDSDDQPAQDLSAEAAHAESEEMLEAFADADQAPEQQTGVSEWISDDDQVTSPPVSGQSEEESDPDVRDMLPGLAGLFIGDPAFNSAVDFPEPSPVRDE